eukprot:7764708-Heterocapsa_arctica.AAC.1
MLRRLLCFSRPVSSLRLTTANSAPLGGSAPASLAGAAPPRPTFNACASPAVDSARARGARMCSCKTGTQSQNNVEQHLLSPTLNN